MRRLLSLITTVAVTVGASFLFGLLLGHHAWTRDAEIPLAVAAGLFVGRLVVRPRVRRQV